MKSPIKNGLPKQTPKNNKAITYSPLTNKLIRI